MKMYVQHFKYMSEKYFTTCFGGLMVECKASCRELLVMKNIGIAYGPPTIRNQNF